jgi:hypothetical protein
MNDCYCSRTGKSTETGAIDADLPWGPDDTVLVVFGSRTIASLGGSLRQQAKATILQLGLQGFPRPDYILSGGAEGADAVAEAIALELECPMVVFAVGSVAERTAFRADLADQPFETRVVASYGDGEGPRSGNGAYLWRNCLMATHATAGIGLWDGDSSGTQRMIHSCRHHDVDPLYIHGI